MKKTRTQKGITLVALIITIVVLLILAAVAIGAAKDSDIIGYAQNAAKDYDERQKEEKGLIEGYEMLLGEQQGIGPWKLQEDGTIKNAKTGETKKIGDTFTNDEVLAATGGTKSSYTGTWSVLGAENGRLKLLSTTNVASNVILGYDDERAKAAITVADEAKVSSIEKFQRSAWSWENAIETLDKYAKEFTGIEKARSITLEDMEAPDILNITEEQKRTITDTNGRNYGYGRTYRYYYKYNKINSQYLEWNEIDDPNVEDNEEEGWSVGGITTKTSYNYIDGGQINWSTKENVYKVKSTFYNLYSFLQDECDINTELKRVLFSEYSWLATQMVFCDSGSTVWRIPMLTKMGERVFEYKDLVSSERLGFSYNYIGVRAIVYI